MKKTLIAVVCYIMAAMAVNAQKVEVIAHRGYWKTEGSAQNSLRALVKADSIACYGSEFDVWMTADGDLVVNHDAVVEGITIEAAKTADVLALKLKNGENMPTLEQYLKLGKD